MKGFIADKMGNIVFIRHAEKTGEGKNAPVSEHGIASCKNLGIKWYADKVLVSDYLRSIETAKILFPRNKYCQLSMLGEYEKHNESEDDFIERVRLALEFIAAISEDHERTAVVSHARFMTVAYQILKQKTVVGFDYLDSFVHYPD